MKKVENPYASLSRIFHEPNRLAILSALCNAPEGLTFNDLKEECELTDGNLSRHLKSLQQARIIRIKKSFVRSKPQTTVYLTDRGREEFVRYLQALEQVLFKAAESVGEKSTLPIALQKLVRA
jgi:DNA-binding MarR family transcriptional regulator